VVCELLNIRGMSFVSGNAMKTLLVTVSLALAGVSAAQAQVFRPSIGASTAVGAVAGGLIGGHNGDRWAEGAVIGGIAGAIVGAAMQPQDQVYAPAPVYQTSNYGYSQPVYSAPTQVVQAAPTVPCAPTVASAPVYVQPAPQVVYAPAPQVVYAPPAVVYAPAPVVSFGYGYGYGYGYRPGPRYYGPSYRGSYYHGHRR
jgi:hypothetical protein